MMKNELAGACINQGVRQHLSDDELRRMSIQHDMQKKRDQDGWHREIFLGREVANAVSIQSQSVKGYTGDKMKKELVQVDVVQVEGEHLTASEYRRIEVDRILKEATAQIDDQIERRRAHEKLMRENHRAAFSSIFACSFESMRNQSDVREACDFKKGDRVYVYFISESRTEFSGKLFKGDGVIDRAEDGYVFGRLSDGRPFMCKPSDVVKLETIESHSEEDSKGMNKSLLFMGVLLGAALVKFFSGL